MEDLNRKIEIWDKVILEYSKNWALPFSRFAIFLIYFWFGALKVFSESPANPLVSALLTRTLPGVSFSSFIVAFGVFEMIIGIVFIIPRFERLAMFLLLVHLVSTALPLFLLPALAWQGFLTPTLEGQYIIKNILIVALAMGILANLDSLKYQRQSSNV